MHLDIHELPNSFKDLKNLTYLNLSYNKLNLTEQFPIFRELPSLKELHVIGNQYDEEIIRAFQKEFPNLKLHYKLKEK